MDATQKAKICEQLTTEIDDLPPILQRAAKYIVDNTHDFGLDPIRLTAKKIGISPNSLVRLARYLEFENFNALREPFRNALVERYDETLSQPTSSRRDQFTKDLEIIKNNEKNIIAKSLQLLSEDQMHKSINALLNARNVYLTATRASYSLAYFFHYVGRIALPNLHLIPRHMGSPIDDLISVDQTDLLFAITFLPYSAETIKALQLAKKRGAKIILMSDSQLIAPKLEIDIFLKVSTHSSHYFGCYAGAMAVIECLLAHLVREAGTNARSRIISYEAIREDFGAYWQGNRR